MNKVDTVRREIKQTLAYVLLAIGCSVWVVGVFGQIA